LQGSNWPKAPDLYLEGLQRSWRVLFLLLRSAKGLLEGPANLPASAGSTGILQVLHHCRGTQGSWAPSSYSSFKLSHQQSSSQTFPSCSNFDYHI